MIQQEAESSQIFENDNPRNFDDQDSGVAIEQEENLGYFQTIGLQATSDNTENLKDSLSSKALEFSDSVSQLQPDSDNSQTATLLTTEPANDSLSELTQEVSAIREFASQQQDRVRQLQDGYDWTIIKRFCIRIIRCIDNLDGRIEKLAGEKQETKYLEDVRDELVFALESSGVEQFKPPINNEYRGFEKFAEALKERVPTKDSGLSGKIAEVTSPGYQYIVSDENVRVVRSAQVKLYS